MVDDHNHAFGEGKLWIKLKIPKHEQEDEDEDSQEKNQIIVNNDNNHTKLCEVCNKSFVSGKALGGHMRIHVQAYKHLINSKKKLKAKQSIKFKKIKNFNKFDDDRKKKPECVLCGKNFPSMKSLFGHMRCHPERDWRGIEPPRPRPPPPVEVKNSSPTSSVSDAEPEQMKGEVDLGESLPRWSVTAKRGRKAILDTSLSEEDKLREAARGVMMLINGDSCHKFETENKNFVAYDVDNDDPDRVLGLKSRRIEESLEGRSSSTSGGNIQPKLKNKKKRKKMKLNDLNLHKMKIGDDNDDDNDDKYKCITCGKSFTTHQALGGHRSSHNKSKIVIQNSINDPDHHHHQSSSENKDQSEEGGGASSSKMVDGNGIHQCNVCNKIFNSGQALGGHKRCHWNGLNEADHDQSRILDFDLNEPPPIEFDDEQLTGEFFQVSADFN